MTDSLFPASADAPERLHELSTYEALDADAEVRLDRIARMAARLFGAPLALVTLLDDERQVFMARVGFDASETPHALFCCTHAIVQDAPVFVEDTAYDERFADSLLSTRGPGVHFYAGCPLRTPGGHHIGTLCVIGPEPRRISEDERILLAELADIAMDELELVVQTQTLAKREYVFRTLADNSPDVIARYDPDLRLRYANPPVEQAMGMERASLIGKRTRELPMPEATALQQERTLLSVFESGQPQALAFSSDTVGGHRHFEALMVPEHDQDGRVVSVLSTTRDVTVQKTVAAELVEAKEAAERMALFQRSFLNNMSHEIRTPLTGILGFIEMLKLEVAGSVVSSEAVLEYAEVIVTCGTRLMETLNSVLELSQLHSGTLELSPVLTDMAVLAQETATLVRPVAAKKGVLVHVEAPSTPLSARVDRGALGRVLLNLAANAVKFTDHGSVVILVRASGADLFIEVSDTGPGIPPSFLSHLFEEFQQASKGLARSHEGAGLGLAITKGLVELLGGTIEVVSAPGRGSQFVVCIPGVVERDDLGWEEVPAVPVEKELGWQPSVLVVEDYEQTRQFVKAALRNASQVFCASDSAEARALASGAEAFDVVLLDINLGEQESGELLLPQLRQSAACRKALFVAMTAYALPGDKERFLRAGFDGYLAKPFTRNSLIAALNVGAQA